MRNLQFYNQNHQTKHYLSLLHNEQQKDNLVQQQDEGERSSCYQLQWRQEQLLVKLSQDVKQLYLPSIESQQWLVQCLKHSPVQMVCIDTNLGSAALKHWANACEQAKKPVFLRGSVPQTWNKKSSKLNWYIKLIDWFATLLLLMALSPVMLALVVLQMYVYSPKAIFSREWCVGGRGKLFNAYRFRTTEVEHNFRTTPLGHWINKYNMHKLPQLFNILRGDMSLLGSRPITLRDAVELNAQEQRYLKALPKNGSVIGLVA